MRTTKELLQVMLENINLLNCGLCSLSTSLYFKGILSSEEMDIVDNYIIYCFPQCTFSYVWPPGEIKPRVKWLKDQIQKLEEEERSRQ